MSFDHEVDLLVVGSGAGGMTAALAASHRGLDALVVESADVYGGTTALSGGTIWVPDNHLMVRKGLRDSRTEALDYLRGLVGKEVPDERLEAYVDAAPFLVAWLEEHSQVRFDSLESYPDYYPAVPGAKPGGRTLETLPYSRTRLGAERARLRPAHPQQLALGRAALTAREARTLLLGGLAGRSLVAGRLAGYWLDLPERVRGREDRRLCLGSALAARLRRSLSDRGVPVWLGSPARELLLDGERVVGAVIESSGATLRIGARRGVVLAAGGFARNATMREVHHASSARAGWTAASPDDLGAGIALGQRAGGAVTLMDEAWWTPTAVVPGETLAWVLIFEKSLPGSLVVDRSGRRFTNESAPYTDVVRAMVRNGSTPAYLIADARYRRHYPLGPLMPMLGTPRALRGSFVHKSRSLPELASALGIDPRGLETTVRRFNHHAARGVDPDFGRGDSLTDRYYGDPAAGPNPCLHALDAPPFYGIEIQAGDLGTKGGLATDARGRVLDEVGAPVPGLYAVGNTSASVMGRAYPGAGATLGPAMTFGYLAAVDAAAARHTRASPERRACASMPVATATTTTGTRSPRVAGRFGSRGTSVARRGACSRTTTG